MCGVSGGVCFRKNLIQCVGISQDKGNAYHFNILELLNWISVDAGDSCPDRLLREFNFHSAFEHNVFLILSSESTISLKSTYHCAILVQGVGGKAYNLT